MENRKIGRSSGWLSSLFFSPLRLSPILLLSLLLTGCSKEEEASAELEVIEAAYEAAEQPIPEKRAAFAPRYRDLVKEYWGTEAALEGALWLMAKAHREAPRSEKPAVVAEFTDSILGRYARSPALWRLAEHASLYTEEQRLGYFGELRESSPHPAVRAAAIFYPAHLEIRRSRPIHRLPGMSKRLDSDNDQDPETLAALRAAEADLRTVLEEYGELPAGNSTYRVMADAVLNAYTAEDLAVGRPAPEIVGATVDGEEMRLSDFRGKVTVIDFWGDW